MFQLNKISQASPQPVWVVSLVYSSSTSHLATFRVSFLYPSPCLSVPFVFNKTVHPIPVLPLLDRLTVLESIYMGLSTGGIGSLCFLCSSEESTSRKLPAVYCADEEQYHK